MNLIPVTYFPAPTQLMFADNQRRVRDKPYARFLTGRMYLRPNAVPALSAPLQPRNAVRPDALRRLLDPADPAAETGYCLLPDGTAYVASRTVFPGASADMLAWWFW